MTSVFFFVKKSKVKMPRKPASTAIIIKSSIVDCLNNRTGSKTRPRLGGLGQLVKTADQIVLPGAFYERGGEGMYTLVA